ncbi:DspFAvrF family protein [Lonsdalea populi]|uniref:DspFAvrF family protein n=1 Tax=Lonsdalea populi TaxID=1172565 RepID=A0A3N0UWC3_9GAMM|nr:MULTISPECIES: type III secretion system chaperone [Lonsdalea]OSM99661.1 DspFAvrF family protein [Lonsdalea populi]OSN02559.1 DspFAvrF family protein [Lonsdalea populi]QPQ25686.1 CesT family type III secretion system chaperone [Lonsdalea populi]RAT16999.1 DspFAvrF family protein [Lonsdalea quercina]RAT31075.1 DspFAvrF family protein [Lonsdalea populi]
MHSQQQVARLLQAFGQATQTSLRLDNGICVLNDEHGEEAAVIDVPAHSEQLLLHCRIASLDGADGVDEVAIFRLMLQLNFEMAAMRGCWLALDEFNQLRLCFQYSLSGLDEHRFNAVLSGFMQQVKESRDFIISLLGQMQAA